MDRREGAGVVSMGRQDSTKIATNTTDSSRQHAAYEIGIFVPTTLCLMQNLKDYHDPVPTQIWLALALGVMSRQHPHSPLDLAAPAILWLRWSSRLLVHTIARRPRMLWQCRPHRPVWDPCRKPSPWKVRMEREGRQAPVVIPAANGGARSV